MQKLILFDFDGVIIDSFPTAFWTQQLMCPDVTEDQYRILFEGNIFNTAQSYLAGTAHSELCRHDIDFWEQYIPKLKQEGRLVAGMDKVIRTLAQNHDLIIVSSGQTLFIENFLVDHHLMDCFKHVMGNDVHKSKEEKIKMVFTKYGTDASQCVFITDTLGDVREATKMNVGAIGVTWGFHEAERLAKGDPFRLVETPALLPASIADYFSSLIQSEG